MIEDLRQLMCQEDINTFNDHIQGYLLTFWGMLEIQFYKFGDDENSRSEAASIIMNTPLWLFSCMVIRDCMRKPAGDKFFEAFKPRKTREHFYKFLESEELRNAFNNLSVVGMSKKYS